MEKVFVVATECEYRQYVKGRINTLLPILARSAVGDYNTQVPMEDQIDDFGELYAGIQFMLEAIQEMMVNLERLEGTNSISREEP
jgi:aminopeptidase-like protein